MSRVAIVASYAPSLINFRAHLIGEMTHAGHEVVALAPGISADIREQLELLGVRKSIDIPLSRAGMNPGSDLRCLVKLISLFRDLRPDMVLSYTIKPVIYGSVAARLAGVEGIYSMITGLGFAFDAATARVVRYATQRLYRLALGFNTCIFFQNPDDLEDMIAARVLDDRDSAMLIDGSGVDLEYYGFEPIPDGVVSFLLIARLLVNKGIREYVAAAREVQAKSGGATFHLVGGADENPAAIPAAEVERWVEEGVVHYHGSVSDVRPYIAASTVYVLPSYREGLPRTVLEAMSMGRPVIATDVPGCRQAVEHGVSGMLVPVRNIGALASAMCRYLGDPELIRSHAQEGRRRAEERFDVKSVSKTIMATMKLI